MKTLKSTLKVGKVNNQTNVIAVEDGKNIKSGAIEWRILTNSFEIGFWSLFLSSPIKLVRVMEWTLGLCRNWVNEVRARGLVKMSTIWRVVGTYCVEKRPWEKISRMKWKSSSICLVWAWNMRFLVIWRALLLSHNSKGVHDREKPMSRSKNEIQVSSAAVEAKDWYSASALEWATIVCFFELQEMQFARR